MKKYLLSALAAGTLLASCTKDATQVVVSSNDTTIVVPPSNPTPAFRVEGVSDLMFEKNPFSPSNIMSEYLNVVYGNGAPQRVMLSLLNLPTGIKDSFSVRSGYPNFQSYLQLTFNNVANGTYTPTLVAKADSGTAQNYNFSIHVSGDTSCNGYLMGNSYTGTSSCITSNGYPVTLSKNGRTGDTFFVDNFRNTGLSMMVLINCKTSTVTIPAQPAIGNVQYSAYGSSFVSTGSGTFMLMLNTMETDLTTGFSNVCRYTINKN